eukprot:13695912-Alexandrium_andersonii.AAC.1
MCSKPRTFASTSQALSVGKLRSQQDEMDLEDSEGRGTDGEAEKDEGRGTDDEVEKDAMEVVSIASSENEESKGSSSGPARPSGLLPMVAALNSLPPAPAVKHRKGLNSG